LEYRYRKTSKYEKAETAYKKSLQVDPRGKTALQNLPVVYLHQNKDSEAIAAYKDILNYYPEDPEVFYGIGIVYFTNIKDMENALQNVCKAYNIYASAKSPYRSDAEKVINMIYKEMKKNNQEDVFNRILKENNIKPN
jgi:tetratricopeptide (TPR) repeat protein